jgi:hypothetical protein
MGIAGLRMGVRRIWLMAFAVDDGDAQIEGKEANYDPDFVGIKSASEHVGNEVDDDEEVE